MPLQSYNNKDLYHRARIWSKNKRFLKVNSCADNFVLEAKGKDLPPIPKSPLSKLSEAGGKQKLKFNVNNQFRSTAGHHANRNDQGYWAQLNEIRKKIVQDLNIDGEEHQYPFDDGWKCSIFWFKDLNNLIYHSF